MTKTGDSPDRIRSRGGAGAIVEKTNRVLLCYSVSRWTYSRSRGKGRANVDISFLNRPSFSPRKKTLNTGNECSVDERDFDQLVDGDIG